MFSATSQCSGAQTTQDASVCRCQHELLTGNSFTGLGQGLRNQLQTGTLRKPSIWANPGPITTMGSSVTIWCRGSRQADAYRLYKEQDSQYWDTWPPRNSADRASFFTESVDIHHAGQFQCAYHSSSGWSELSDPLLLVVTGAYSKPSLSAHPSHLVVSGGNVSLSCSSQNITDTFHLLKEREAYPSQQRKSEFSVGRHQATFPVGPVSTSHGGIYRCYGSLRNYPYVWSQPSDSVDLTVTGTYEKPSLSAHPGPSVTSGDSVTLQCRSDQFFDTFHLFKEGLIAPPQQLSWQNNTGPFQTNFTMSPVTSAHGGTYRCYSSHRISPYLFSQPSDPLELVVSASHPETTPRAGGSENQRHTPRDSDPPRGLPEYLKVLIGDLVAHISLLIFLLLFLFNRCHHDGKGRTRMTEPKDRGLPKREDFPKDPGPPTLPTVPTQSPNTPLFFPNSSPATEDQEENICEEKRKGSPWGSQMGTCPQNVDAAVKDKQPEEEMEMDSQQSPEEENPQARVYAQVNHHSGPRWGGAISPSTLSGELQDMKDKQSGPNYPNGKPGGPTIYYLKMDFKMESSAGFIFTCLGTAT
ncbi:leukocyte immunoglobulin-like receptor subfamily B member 4 isoform X1 [Loxodonta africana]|uniref:leukocyte immunoglobulin-like receptor subfamily B member 4 isoform X1 n=1 Tax=Loxodonta africana TaxID=9785 RepID=UPI000C81247B|nr:leukocyte immunoglobulin-like receptor subfamily B member 4 isoform X17 [Loxodonta africana]